MVYTHLTQEERYQIYALLRQGESQKSIADQLDRHPATISRELRRNRGQRGYRARQAQQLAHERRPRNARSIAPHDWQYAKAKLRQGWSPEQISGRGRRDGVAAISHETIYLKVYADKAAGGDLWRHLRCQKKKRKRYASGRDRRGQIVGRRPIGDRPAIVDNRGRLGDWEGDTIIGARHRHALVSIVERRTQYLVLRKVPRKSAADVSMAMIEGMAHLRRVAKTITVDNGKEFAEHALVDRVLETTTYFANPYASWERGLNEQINGKVRDYFPKKMPFDRLTQRDADRVAETLNNRPRKSLNYRTPREEMIRLAALQGVALHI